MSVLARARARARDRAASLAPLPSGLLTIDDLVVRSGIPSRTIRFYRTQGALPPPVRRGRAAVYTEEHVERLLLIGMLQDRGLRLRTIRDLLRHGSPQATSLSGWLGLEWQAAAAHPEDGNELDSESQKTAPLTQPDVDVCALLRAGGLRRLRRNLVEVADELAGHLAVHARRRLGRGATAGQLRDALDRLRPAGVEGVRVMFAEEMERAVSTLLETAERRRAPQLPDCGRYRA